MPSFKEISPSSQEVSQLQDNVSDAFSIVFQDPSIVGTIVKTKLSAGSNSVAHRLGKKFLGWDLWDVDAPATIHRVSDLTPEKTITLFSSAPCNVTIRIF